MNCPPHPVYEYRYHHVGSSTITDFFDASWLGPVKLVLRILGRYAGLDLFANGEWCNHGDELFVMWKPMGMETAYTDADKKVGADMVEMWTNFAAHGDPTSPTVPAPGMNKFDRNYFLLQFTPVLSFVSFGLEELLHGLFLIRGIVKIQLVLPLTKIMIFI